MNAARSTFFGRGLAQALLVVWALIFSAQTLALDPVHDHDGVADASCIVCAIADIPNAPGAPSASADVVVETHPVSPFVQEVFVARLACSGYQTRAPPKT